MSFLDGLLQVANQPQSLSPPRERPNRMENELSEPPPSEQRRTVQIRRDREQQPKFQIIKNQLGERLNRIYRFPASLNEAKVHAKASMNGYKTPLSRVLEGQGNVPTQMCPCCQNFVNTIQIPLTYNTYPKKVTPEQIQQIMTLEAVARLPLLSQKIFQIQSGDALFFCFVKLIITYLCIRFFIYDGYNLATNLVGVYCELPKQVNSAIVCVAPWVDYTATPNKNTPLNQNLFLPLDILQIIFTLLSIVFFIYGRVKLKQLYELLQGWDVTEDDYTLLIEDIPLIPFDANDDRVQDVPGEYKQFLTYNIQKKVRSWLNSFNSYHSQDGIESTLDRQFYRQVYHHRKDNEEQQQLYDQIVASINLCYDLTQLQNLQVLRSKVVQDFIDSEGKEHVLAGNLFEDENQDQQGSQQFQEGDKYISFLPNQVQIINRHYIKVCQRIAQMASNNVVDQNALPVDELKISRFVGKAFVSLKYQHYKSYLLDRYQRDHNFMKVNGNKIALKITGATKPSDIKWINMKISDQFRKQQLRNSYLLVTISIVVAGAALYGLTELKTQYYASIGTTKKTSVFQSLFVLSLPLWTYIVNYALSWGLGQLNVYQRHKTKTQELTSLIIKNIISKFFNTAFIYALIFYFGPKINFLNANGLVYTIVSLIYVNAGINLALQALQPFYIYYDWRNKKTFQSVDSNGKIGLFQTQLNQLVERPAYTYDYAYSYYLQMMYIVAFYGYLVPLITPLTILAFALQYWVDKYNLFRRFSSPIDLGYYLTDLIWKAVELTLILNSLGHMLWSYSLHKEPSMMNKVSGFVCLGISLLYTIWILGFPKSLQTLTDRFLKSNGIHIGTYQEEVKKFSKTYQTLNPATSFADKGLNLEEDLIARFTDYSILEAQRILYRKKFIPQNERELKQIWESKENLTTIETIKQSIDYDFKTMFCCC